MEGKGGEGALGEFFVNGVKEIKVIVLSFLLKLLISNSILLIIFLLSCIMNVLNLIKQKLSKKKI